MATPQPRTWSRLRLSSSPLECQWNTSTCTSWLSLLRHFALHKDESLAGLSRPRIDNPGLYSASATLPRSLVRRSRPLDGLPSVQPRCRSVGPQMRDQNTGAGRDLEARDEKEERSQGTRHLSSHSGMTGQSPLSRSASVRAHRRWDANFEPVDNGRRTDAPSLRGVPVECGQRTCMARGT